MLNTKHYDGSLLPRETRNSIFFRNEKALLGSVIQYNAEKLVQDELKKDIDKVSTFNCKNILGFMIFYISP